MSSKDNIKAEEGLVGQVINDRYRIEALLGRGNVGVVYRATDQQESRQVALKIIKFDLAEQGMRTRFDHDAETVAKIQHPNAVAVYDYGLLSTGGGYVTMEFIEGRTLRDLLRESKTLPLDQALRLIKQVCEPVSAAHKLGVIHRDLKPENIMLPSSTGGRTVKVVDLGLAKLKEGVGESKANLTSAGEVMGTPCYMSPEQCLGTGIDERTDIYAIGIILFEMLAGKPPFEGNFFSVLRMHMSKPLPSIREFVPGLPQPAEGFINELLSKEKEKRPKSVDEVLQKIDALEKAVASGAVASAPAAVPQPAGGPAPKPQPAAAPSQPVAAAKTANPPMAAAPPQPVAPPQPITPPAPAATSPSSAAAAQPAKSNTMIYVVVVVVLAIVLFAIFWALKK